MAGKGNPPNVAKSLNPLYPAAPPDNSRWKRVLRVLGWAAFVAAVTALAALLAVWTGGISIAASQSLVTFVAKEALIGAVEGLLFAGAAEWQGNRAVAKALSEQVRKHVR